MFVIMTSHKSNTFYEYEILFNFPEFLWHRNPCLCLYISQHETWNLAEMWWKISSVRSIRNLILHFQILCKCMYLLPGKVMSKIGEIALWWPDVYFLDNRYPNVWYHGHPDPPRQLIPRTVDPSAIRSFWHLTTQIIISVVILPC